MSHATNPQDSGSQQRFTTDGVTAKRGPGRTTGITKSSDGKTSFNKVSGQIQQPAISRGPGPGATTGITKSSDGKTSFKRV